MERSESIKEIGKALGLFHTKVAKIPKTDSNPFFKSKYAALPSILDAIQIPLEESGLVFTQLPDGEFLTTLLIHFESGEYISSSYKMNPVKTDPQSIGSAITYARRYALGAILGLNIDEDDDGNKASQPQKPAQSQEVELPWLNLLDKEGNPKEKILARLQQVFAEGQTIDELKKSVRISKSDLEYIKNKIHGNTTSN
jgi:hypothetical protein